ncbi:peptidase family M13 [Oesophagostomum dentatum]|uniref:Peptidase family M13 n=1 Tax=Oesophagostomum dentatum TaxID=61180 RepID=A0A0B1TR30_OESDE|nr:peptidase family M13 [Oesophagostomum dentatum]
MLQAKLLGANTGLVGAICALAIASLVFNILIWNKVNKDDDVTKSAPIPVEPIPLEEVRIRTDPVTTTKDKPRTIAFPMKTRLRTISSTFTAANPTNSKPLPVRVNDTIYCPSYGKPDTSDAYKEAASYLLSGLDQSVDPCEDFYAFSCNTYVKNHNASEIGVSRVAAYDEAQQQVDVEIVEALQAVDIGDSSQSLTERLTKAALLECVYHSRARTPVDNSKDVLIEMRDLFGGIPFLNHSLKEGLDFFSVMGELEQNHAMGSLLHAAVSVDFKNVQQHTLFISQPILPIPRDYYVLPQHTTVLEDRIKLVTKVLQSFAETVLDDASPYIDLIKTSARDVVKLEMQIAMASWPESAMRNYAQQYNPYKLEQLEKAYPSIKWKSYFNAMLSTVSSTFDITKKNIIIAQPSYFGWLNALFTGETVDAKTIANYLLTHLIFEDADFMGGNIKTHVMKSDYVRYALRKGKGATRIGVQQFPRIFRDSKDDPNIECLNTIMVYMPFGPGYVYVKSKKNRDDVAKDIQHQTELVFKSFMKMIKELEWMSTNAQKLAAEKATKMIRNYGWPKDLFGDFSNSQKVDAYHQTDYGDIINYYKTNSTHLYYKIRKTMLKGYSNRESFRTVVSFLNRSFSRDQFLMSPAMVNAWYAPERNSITFPYAIWNPPYYNYGYPQAYNYGGQAGTGGHELVHGFDDQGVQFGADGSLSGCTWIECGWMEPEVKASFNNMAQCVVTQYSTQCCPAKSGNIRCANGETTQGENIADIGGQLAAYYAYREYVKELGKEEMRLPGLEQYTPNQLFWISYGFTWCMSQTESKLISQLLTDLHAPGSCRVNQVMQDIPEFAKDFGCTIGQNMYPLPEQRCAVWVSE